MLGVLQFFLLFSSDASLLEREMRGATHLNGYTNQGAAFRQAENILSKADPTSDKYVIMITDGEPNIENGTERTISQRMKSQQGVSIIMVGKC